MLRRSEPERAGGDLFQNFTKADTRGFSRRDDSPTSAHVLPRNRSASARGDARDFAARHGMAAKENRVISLDRCAAAVCVMRTLPAPFERVLYGLLISKHCLRSGKVR